MHLRTNKCTLLLLLTLGVSAPTLAVVTSAEGGAVPNIDTSITETVELVAVMGHFGGTIAGLTVATMLVRSRGPITS